MKKILLIEDDKEFIAAIREQLSDTEFKVLEITEGIRSDNIPKLDLIVEQTVKIDPDYIFADLDLIGDGNCEHGLRLLRKLCSHPKLKEKWISVLSVYVAAREFGTVEMQNHKNIAETYGAKKVIYKEDIRRNNQIDAQLLLSHLPGFEEHLPHVMIFEDQDRVIKEYEYIFRGKAICNFQRLSRLNKDLINTILQFKPDLIIVDLRLVPIKEIKEYSGLRLIRDIRGSDRLPQMVIVVCSKYINPLPDDTYDPETTAALEAGADAAFSKTPFPTAEQFLKVTKRPIKQTEEKHE